MSWHVALKSSALVNTKYLRLLPVGNEGEKKLSLTGDLSSLKLWKSGEEMIWMWPMGWRGVAALMLWKTHPKRLSTSWVKGRTALTHLSSHTVQWAGWLRVCKAAAVTFAQLELMKFPSAVHSPPPWGLWGALETGPADTAAGMRAGS